MPHSNFGNAIVEALEGDFISAKELVLSSAVKLTSDVVLLGVKDQRWRPGFSLIKSDGFSADDSAARVFRRGADDQVHLCLISQ